MLGFQELLLVLILVLIFFGAEKIPELARAMGKGVAEFRKAQQEFKGELTKAQATATNDPNDSFIPSGKPRPVVCACQAGKSGNNDESCCSPGPVCPNCQRSLLPGDRFCASCGKPVAG